MQEFLGAPSALAVNSCTSAMHLALQTLGVTVGDEVITTPMTFAATVNVIEHVGARPVLVDVEPDTLNIDPKLVAEAITPRTKALLPVHFAGHPAELEPLRSLSIDHGLVVLEDAAHALPARYDGRLIGSHDNPAAFSFYATKNLTTGEGGLLTGPEDFIDLARVTSLHGMSRDAWKRYSSEGNWYYEIVEPGFKYNMSDLQAAIGLRQLDRLEGFHVRRRQIAEQYSRAFADTKALEVPRERPHVQSAWHLYVLRLVPKTLKIDRDGFIRALAERKIGSSVHFIPIHTHPYYRDRYGYEPTQFPVAFENYGRMLSLPLHPGLTDRDVEDVIEAVLDVVEQNSR